jgi:hypothetical protein
MVQWKDYDEILCVEAWPMMGIDSSRSDVGTACYYDNPWRQIYYTSVSSQPCREVTFYPHYLLQAI